MGGIMTVGAAENGLPWGVNGSVAALAGGSLEIACSKMGSAGAKAGAGRPVASFFADDCRLKILALVLTGDFLEPAGVTGAGASDTAAAGLGASFIGFGSGAGATGLGAAGFGVTAGRIASGLDLAGTTEAADAVFAAAGAAAWGVSVTNLATGNGAEGIEAAGFSSLDFAAAFTVDLGLAGSVLAAAVGSGFAVTTLAVTFATGLDFNGSAFDTAAAAGFKAAGGALLVRFEAAGFTGVIGVAAVTSGFAGALARGTGAFAGLAAATGTAITAGDEIDFTFGRGGATPTSILVAFAGAGGAGLTVFRADRASGAAAGELGLGPGPEAGEPGLDGVFTGAESRSSARRVQRFCNGDCRLEPDRPAAISAESCRWQEKNSACCFRENPTRHRSRTG